MPNEEPYILLHREAVDLHKQLLRCVELSQATPVVRDFYVFMCDSIGPAMATALSPTHPASAKTTGA